MAKKNERFERALKQFIQSHNLVAYSVRCCGACTNCHCASMRIGYSNFSPASGRIKNKLRRLLGLSEKDPIDVRYLVEHGYLHYVGSNK